MGTELSTTRQLSGIARRLAVEHDACTKSANDSLEHAKRAGGLLCDAKELVKHGEWEGWLTEHFSGDASTAQIYMRIFRHWPEVEAKAEHVPLLSLRGAVKLLSKPRAVLPAPEPEPAPEVEEPNPPETPDSPPDGPTSPQSVPADEDGLDDDQDPGERLAGASVAQGPVLEVDAESIPCTKAYSEIRDWLQPVVEKIHKRHPTATRDQVKAVFEMVLDGIYG